MNKIISEAETYITKKNVPIHKFRFSQIQIIFLHFTSCCWDNTDELVAVNASYISSQVLRLYVCG